MRSSNQARVSGVSGPCAPAVAWMTGHGSQSKPAASSSCRKPPISWLERFSRAAGPSVSPYARKVSRVVRCAVKVLVSWV